jgi:hypothetical protein
VGEQHGAPAARLRQPPRQREAHGVPVPERLLVPAVLVLHHPAVPVNLQPDERRQVHRLPQHLVVLLVVDQHLHRLTTTRSRVLLHRVLHDLGLPEYLGFAYSPPVQRGFDDSLSASNYSIRACLADGRRTFGSV